jgi:transcriptional antiterminator RfaH
MMRWYAVHTRAQSEEKAAWHLRNQGFAIYLPRYLKTRRHARRTDTVAAPFFPRYLFLAMDPAAAKWRAIRSTVGVSHLVCSGDVPAPVPHGVIDAIKAREGRNGMIALAPPQSGLNPGDPVCIAGGIFAGVDGLFEHISDEKRVVILMELLGRRIRARVPLATVTAAA